MLTRTIRNTTELTEFAQHLLVELSNQVSTTSATIIALHGDLGAGKTTFVQALATQLGVSETVTSPTFVVMKSYETNNEVFTHLVHIDAYRIEHTDEMRQLGFSGVVSSPGTLVCIEWAEKIATLLPHNAVHLELTTTGDETRTITYGEKK
jgi:tRNA threonylcarbamoyladenosine biosynthesis protein TsaE